jgi:hypothetical protein
MRLGGEFYPLTVTRGFGGASLRAISIHSAAYKINTPHVNPDKQVDVARLQGIVMYIDPAGGGKNGDETGYAITGFLNGNIFLLSAGGVPGGYNVAQMEYLAAKAAEWKVNTVIIEKNMGYGAFREVFLPFLRAVHQCNCVDDLVLGQKELRIIETLEPVIARGSLIINEAVLEEDRDTSVKYEASKRTLYTLFHQLSKITRDKNSLFHDDRLDAVEGAVRHWVQMLAINQSEAVERLRIREAMEAFKDPLGHTRYDTPSKRGGSVFNRFRRLH